MLKENVLSVGIRKPIVILGAHDSPTHANRENANSSGIQKGTHKQGKKQFSTF